MLVQIHMIQNHAPSNLNRDDTGAPKEALFGSVMRARISSQCLKRSIRQSEIFQAALKGHLGARTRRLPQEIEKALRANGCAETAIAAITKKASALGSDKESDEGLTRQLIFLGAGEIDALAAQLVALYMKDPTAFVKMKDDDLGKAMQKFMPRSVDIALFGRMTTSVAFEDVQAAAQVAHAISTHKVERQFDYFTAVDDLKDPAEDDAGAGMIGDVEFNSATYYKYFAIDVEALAENLGGDRELAIAAVSAFLRAAAMSIPSGKQNTFAAHNLPDAILTEVSEDHIAVSYANAFVKPVRATEGHDLVSESIMRLSEYVGQVTTAYGLQRNACCLTTRGEAIGNIERVASVDALITRTVAALSVAEAV